MPDNIINDYEVVNLENFIDDLEEIKILAKPKIEISKAIVKNAKDQGLSIRKLAKNVGLTHSQLVRITSGDYNYNIETLLKVLNGLDLEIVLKKRS